jgi:hypothetical protein
MLRQLGDLPAECKKQTSRPDAAEFSKWQHAVVSYKRFGRGISLPGLTKRVKLNPPLGSTVYHMRFSLDGKYLLAQDDSGISVMTREPFASLFRISAPSAYPAQFTPDSRQIVLYTQICGSKPGTSPSNHSVQRMRSCAWFVPADSLSARRSHAGLPDDNASLILFDVKQGSPIREEVVHHAGHL